MALIAPAYEWAGILPEPQSLKAVFGYVEELIRSGSALSVSTPGFGSVAESVFKACVGNRIGFAYTPGIEDENGLDLLDYYYGSFVVELADTAELAPYGDAFAIYELGETTEGYTMTYEGEKAESIDLAELQELWEGAIESVFPYRTPASEAAHLPAVEPVSYRCADPGASARSTPARSSRARA